MLKEQTYITHDLRKKLVAECKKTGARKSAVIRKAVEERYRKTELSRQSSSVDAAG